jgi:hypothetical protein
MCIVCLMLWYSSVEVTHRVFAEFYETAEGKRMMKYLLVWLMFFKIVSHFCVFLSLVEDTKLLDGWLP